MRYISDRDIARDILHDGFIVVYNKIGGFRHEGSFEGWLRRVFVNTALGHLRKHGAFAEAAVEVETLVDHSSQSGSALEMLEAIELMKIIGELPVGYRTVLNMYAIEGYSHKEIAQMLNISEGTSRSQYLRAKAHLQKLVCHD